MINGGTITRSEKIERNSVVFPLYFFTQQPQGVSNYILNPLDCCFAVACCSSVLLMLS